MVTETANRCGLRIVTGAADATQLAQVLLNIIQYNQKIESASKSPRLQPEVQSLKVSVEGIVEHFFKGNDPPYIGKNYSVLIFH